ncbi:MAG: Asp-tRNA(Asn)/Glu-tRNA(Gln) amidotransferase subunit GatB [DPANN group archaeon]|nr:Asp-tRNA(Asn)/Glu-tRNA(Gln) amidotransferase subunit GatB [DPANN group archaeon]
MSVMIGLETHIQLKSESKMFCSCGNPISSKKTELEPNTLTCPTCLGLPGSKPSVNKTIIDSAIKAALALNCKIAGEIYFSRKTYFYPDMNKNYQITQYEIPLAEAGYVMIDIADKKKKIRINRLHIEEDPGKLIHINDAGKQYTLVDYNRAGTPLIEVVTEPDFDSPESARNYLQKLGQIMEYLGIYDFTSDASMRSDGNISTTIDGKMGQRVEIKNITGTKFVEKALKYEEIRQKNVIRRGGTITLESRMWNAKLNITKESREKETESDYGYIFEPDLTKITITKKQIEDIKKSLPELPEERLKRIVKEYKINEKTAESIVSEKAIADLFEEISDKIDVKIAAAWLSGQLKKTLNWNNIKFANSGLKKEWIITLFTDFNNKKYTDHTTEQILRKMVEIKKDPNTVAKELGLNLETKMDLNKIAKDIISKNEKAVEDYKNGNYKSINFLVGQIIRETKGQTDAKTAKDKILELIK